VDVLDEVAQARGKSIPQVALNWLLRRPGISSLIVGARNETQLRDNLGAVGWSLTEEEVRRLEAASDVPEIYPYWHQHKWGLERNPLVALSYQG
jgi:aryl-alcohol dehydrogenase (NADP+)